jgi:triosephosphate isomerase
MRRPFIAGNWKLYKTIPEAVDLARALTAGLAGVSGRDVMVAPPFTALEAVGKALVGGPVLLGAQDVFWEQEGAWTGEISPRMLRDAGCAWAIVGHSERRQHFGETDATANRKVLAALAGGLSVILCVGETLAEREAGRTLETVGRQFREGLAGVVPDAARLAVAYEPVWAIGTGRTASPAQAQEVHRFIRNEAAALLGAGIAAALRILYGGSVKPDNVAELMGQADVDGALVGGASLKAESFLALVRY